MSNVYSATRYYDDPSPGSANPFISYWGTEELIKVFPLAIWKVKEMLASSGNDKIALRVVDIENPGLVTAKWVVYNDFLRNSNSPGNVRYYVFSFEMFYGGRLADNLNFDGFYHHVQSPFDTIAARIARDQSLTGADACFVCFDLVVEGVPFRLPPGAGGNGLSSGLRVPV